MFFGYRGWKLKFPTGVSVVPKLVKSATVFVWINSLSQKKHDFELELHTFNSHFHICSPQHYADNNPWMIKKIFILVITGQILLQNVGGSLVWNQYIHPVYAEVKFYKHRIPILTFRGVLKATLMTLCFILLTSNFNRWKWCQKFHSKSYICIRTRKYIWD